MRVKEMFETGRVVYSAAGRDKHRFYAVVGHCEGEVLIADGKRRKIEKPKRKNVLHLRPTNTVLEAFALSTDKQLRKALAPLNNGTASTRNQTEGGTRLV